MLSLLPKYAQPSKGTHTCLMTSLIIMLPVHPNNDIKNIYDDNNDKIWHYMNQSRVKIMPSWNKLVVCGHIFVLSDYVPRRKWVKTSKMKKKKKGGGIHFWADSRFEPSQWEMGLLFNDISHWLGANLESTLYFWANLIVASQGTSYKECWRKSCQCWLLITEITISRVMIIDFPHRRKATMTGIVTSVTVLVRLWNVVTVGASTIQNASKTSTWMPTNSSVKFVR